jgi:hypothetical protein
MRGLGLMILLGATACASLPGRDGPATPTTSDTVRYPGDAKGPPGRSPCARRRYRLDEVDQPEKVRPTSLPASTP